MRTWRAVALGIALTSVPLGAAAADVKFVNNGTQVIHVFAHSGGGACANKPDHTRFALGPKNDREVGASSASVCYSLSYLDENQPPFAAGEAKTGSTVDVSNPPKEDFHAHGIGRARGGQFDWPITSFPRPRIPPILTWPASPIRIEYVVAIWRDPLTPPHTKTECTSEAWGDIPFDGQWRTCNGYSTQCQWMERRLVLIVEVNGVTADDLNKAVDKCLKQASVAAALSAVVAAATGGAGLPAAEAAFVATLAPCLTNELGGKAVKIDLRNDGGWTSWVGC